MVHRKARRNHLLTVAAATAALLLVGAALEAQPSGGYTAPRTAWGVPDLQGIWTNATLTPVERPDSMDGQVLTAEEAAAFETRSAEARAASDTFIPGNVGAYNQFWMDGGKVVTGDRRTSPGPGRGASGSRATPRGTASGRSIRGSTPTPANAA